MTRLFAAVGPMGEIKFDSIAPLEQSVVIESNELRYGGFRILPVDMRLFKGDLSELPTGAALWAEQGVAWVWRNADGSYWMDTLSQDEADAVAWSTSRSRSEAMGMKVVPVQFVCKMTARQRGDNVRKQISDAKARGDVIAEAVWS